MKGDAVMAVLTFLTVALIAGIVVGSLVYEKYACEARWRNSGRKTSWGLMQRCLVENDQGILVPERAIRFMEDK